MNTTELQAKIEAVRKKFTDEDSQIIISESEKTIRRAIMQSKLAEQEPIILLIADIEAKINSINSVLQFDETISDAERNKLFAQRSVHQFYLDRFSPKTLEDKLNALSRFLDSRLQDEDE